MGYSLKSYKPVSVITSCRLVSLLFLCRDGDTKPDPITDLPVIKRIECFTTLSVNYRTNSVSPLKERALYARCFSAVYESFNAKPQNPCRIDVGLRLFLFEVIL